MILQGRVSSTLPEARQFEFQVRNSWALSFQERNDFRCFQWHGDEGDADVDATDPYLTVIR